MDTPASTTPHPRQAVLRLVDAGTLLLRVLTTAVALLGLLVTPAVLLLVAPAAAAAGYVLTACAGWYLSGHRPRRHVPATVATAAGGALPFAHGVDLLGAVGTGIGVTVFVLATTSTLGWIERFDDTPAAVAEPDASWHDLVQVLPLGMLLAESHALEQRLREDPSAPAPLWQVRALLLQEILARDPAAVARWENATDTATPDAPGDGVGV